MTTITKYNPPWECSLAYEQHYHERRDRIARTLFEWGSSTNTKWPERARHIDMTDLSANIWDHTSRLVELGRASIERKMYASRLLELFPQWPWPNDRSYSVFFTEHIEGNVVFPMNTAAQLHAYILGTNTLRLVRLGCHHPHPTCTRIANCYREYVCESCGRRWGEDSSG